MEWLSDIIRSQIEFEFNMKEHERQMLIEIDSQRRRLDEMFPNSRVIENPRSA